MTEDLESSEVKKLQDNLRFAQAHSLVPSIRLRTKNLHID